MVKLTPREKEILEMVVQGKTSSDIAAQLGIACKTVTAHRYQIHQKYGVHSVTALLQAVETERRRKPQ